MDEIGPVDYAIIAFPGAGSADEQFMRGRLAFPGTYTTTSRFVALLVT